jgi:AcrR family transcriptional regulator
MEVDAPGTPIGRPRDTSIDAAVLEATRNLLIEGAYSSFGMGAIADRAGTTRQAVYRRWPNKALLVLDAVFTHTVATGIPDLGDMRAELRAAAQALADEFGQPAARAAVGGLLADLAGDAALHDVVRTGLLGPEHDRVGAIVERARSRGEVDPTADADVAVQALGGAIVYRTCFLGLPADREFLDAVVDLVVRGVSADHRHPPTDAERKGPR